MHIRVSGGVLWGSCTDLSAGDDQLGGVSASERSGEDEAFHEYRNWGAKGEQFKSVVAVILRRDSVAVARRSLSRRGKYF